MLPVCLLLVACQGEPPSAPAAPPAEAPAAHAQAEAAGPTLVLPIACRPGVDCEIQTYVDRDPGPGATDYRCGTRTYDDHSGVDFRLPDMTALSAGVAVLAAADGVVARIRDGVRDVSVDAIGAAAVEGAECGNGVVVDHGGGWTTQYCHLRNGSVSVAPGDAVRAGQAIAAVGLSGNTEYAHLHMTVRHDGIVIDPFAPGPAQGDRCGSGAGMWATGVGEALTYKAGAVLNTGFSSGPVDMAQVEAGTAPPASGTGGALVAYVRAIGLKIGDVQSLRVTGPDGAVVVDTVADPLPGNQAQRLMFSGKRAPAGGWPPGRYEATYAVRRDGQVVLETRFSLQL
jgi:hypothetical protein